MKLLRETNGSILIELAFVLPVFVLILAGLADYAFWIVEKIQLQEAATAGAEYATIPGNQTDIVGMKAAAKNSAIKFNVVMTANAVDVYSCTPGGVIVTSTASCSGLSGPLLFVQVTTTATEYPVLKFTGLPTSVPLQGYATLEVVP